MSYHAANEAKATFDEAYTAPTPHAYVDAMARTGYEIGEQARPYCVAAAELLKQRNGDAWPAQMLDVGCSYGMGAAFVKYGCSFDEIVAFFSSRAPTEYLAAREAMRVWLNVAPPACDLRTVGLDSSEPAIRFAVDSGLLDGGIAKDFEQPDASPSELERSWFRSCNLLISTGAIGYVTDRTLEAVLGDLGKDHPGAFGPLAVVTILRMFDAAPIEAVFERHGLRFGVVPDIRLPQRRFADARERRDVLATLEQRGIDTEGWEDRGKHYADLYVAAPAEHFGLLVDRMTETRLAQAGELQSVGYIHR
jgi:carnitine O-acetyltransferase